MAFLARRREVPGYGPNAPLFVDEVGAVYSKRQFNKDLKNLLAMYPELVESERDLWSGHSFREGIEK